LQAWVIQVILVLIVQGLVAISAKRQIAVGRMVVMTAAYLVPLVGLVFVVLVALQAFNSVSEKWAGNESIFQTLADGYEE
jgi:hypothetical protein